MRWHRVRSVMLHAWHHMLHSRETWIDLGWLPIINTLAIGGFSIYFASQANAASLQFTMLAIVLWFVIEIGTYSIAVGALWEIWAKSFSSLFISPLTVEEFVVGHMLFSLFKQVLVLALLTIMSLIVFHVSPLSFGLMLPLYAALLGIYGWAFGMFVFGLILRFGTGLQSLGWGLIFVLQPLIGIFYPVDMLPPAIQFIARLLAPSYVFKSARHQLVTGSPLWGDIGKAFVFDIVAFIVGYAFMKFMWERARRFGSLARMEE